MDKISKGKIGESAAVAYLKSRGYSIIEVNWETPVGEIDIIAGYGGTIVFCEVKSRSSYKYGAPAEAVDHRKQRKLSMMAAQYIKKKKLFGAAARFDVLEVTGRGVNHIENAFESRIFF